MRWIKYTGLFIFLVLLVLYYSGEKPSYADANPIIEPLNLEISDLEAYISDQEKLIPDLKPGNNAQIIWADSILKQKTEYSIVYLHGFSASHQEGAPIHKDLAERFNSNLFLSRLEDHGRLDSNSFVDLTPSAYLESAKRAVEIGRLLGDKVIIMSCSTGGTLSSYLCANNPWIHAQIMLSPNIDLYSITSEMLTLRWGKTLARMTFKGNYNRIPYSGDPKNYWNSIYHINGILCIKYIIEKWMKPENFNKITQPTFVATYYKNEDEQDKTISVDKIRKFYSAISTDIDQKKYLELAEAKTHVIGSSFFSKELENLRDSVFQFAEEVLEMQAINIESDLELQLLD